MIAMPNDNQPDPTPLFARVCNGVATAEELRELDTLLQCDSRARQLWWEFIGLEAGIIEHLHDGTPLVDLPAATNDTSPTRKRRSDVRGAPSLARRASVAIRAGATTVGRFVRQYPVISCSVAAVVVAGLVGVLALAPPPGLWPRGAGGHSADPVFVAQLSNTHQAQWGPGQLGSIAGAHLQAGHRYALTSGFAEIHFRRGASVVLEGPAEFVITGDNAGRLNYGKLAAEATASARGFQIDTRWGRVVDLGTAFGVDAPRSGPLAIHCFRGSITFEPRGQSALRLTAGEAIDQCDREQTPQHVQADITQFVSSLRLRDHVRTDERGMIVDSRFKSNVALGKPAMQSSTHSPKYPAALATDGDTKNFTHTATADSSPSLTIDLAQPYDIDAVFIHNRDDCCGARLQDIFVDILADDGESVVFTSANLNEQNIRNDPLWLAVALPELTGDKVRGRYVRIRRQAQPGESGNASELGDRRVLSIGEVQVFADEVILQPSPLPDDTQPNGGGN